jgi:hypothetical protein
VLIRQKRWRNSDRSSALDPRVTAIRNGKISMKARIGHRSFILYCCIAVFMLIAFKAQAQRKRSKLPS